MTTTNDDLILLFGGDCSACSGIARRVAAVCDGDLQARPLSDREVGTWLARESIHVPTRPSLLVRHATGVRLFGGVRMAVELLRRLGPRRALAVLRAVGEGSAPVAASGPGRRSLLKSLAGGAGVVATSVLVAPAARADDDVRLTAQQSEAILRRAGTYDRAASIDPELADRGFSTEPYDEIVVGTSETDAAVLTIYARADGSRDEAAVVALRIDGERVSASMDIVLRQAPEQPSRTQGTAVGVGDSTLVFTPVATASDGVTAARGVGSYTACMFACVGANCAAQASRCRGLIYAPAILACMAAVCASKANTCHRVCRGRL